MKLNIKSKFELCCDLSLRDCSGVTKQLQRGTSLEVVRLEGEALRKGDVHWDIFFKDMLGCLYSISSIESVYNKFIENVKLEGY